MKWITKWRAKWPNVSVGVAFFGILAIFNVAEARDDSRAQRLEQQGEAVIRFVRDPDAVPEFAVKGIDGSTVNLANAHGKVVILNFWATWCGPCHMEVPEPGRAAEEISGPAASDRAGG